MALTIIDQGLLTSRYIFKVYIGDKLPKLSRKRKMTHKSMIGYLIGYIASNIVKVWMPEQGKVVEVRDADFDEKKPYDPTMPFIQSGLNTVSRTQQATVDTPTHKGDLSQYRPLENSSEDDEALSSESEAEDRGTAKVNQQKRLLQRCLPPRQQEPQN
jgi:hypothetical protein